MSGSVGNEYIERGNPENMRMLFGIFYFMCSRTRSSFNYFRFKSRHFVFPMSASVADESIKTGDPENMGVAVGI